MRRWWWIILIVLVLALIGVGVARSKKDNGLPVGIETVTRGEFVREVSGTGSVEAKVYSLTFAQPGQVARIPVREGDHVKAGAVLVELDINTVRADLEAARQELQARNSDLITQDQKARAGRAKLEADLRDAEKKLTVSKRLQAIGAESQDALDLCERQVRELRANLSTTIAENNSLRQGITSQRAALQAQVQGYEKALRESRITAPVTGVVSEIGFRIGEMTTGGAVKLVEDGTLRVRAQISEAEATEVSVGLPANIELDAAPDNLLSAYVDKLGVVASVKGEGGSATLPVTLRFKDIKAATQAKPNFTVTAHIVAKRLPATLQIPLEALIEEKTDGKTSYSVWLVDPKRSTVSKQAITVTARSLTKAAIEGLAEGTKVVTLPPDDLKAGTKVKKQTDKPAAGDK